MFIGPCIIAIVDEWNTNLMSLAILFHLLCAQHVSDINMSIFRSLRLCWWITTSVVLFSVRCVLELLLRLVFCGVRFAGWSCASACKTNTTQNQPHQISNTQRTENKTTDVVIQQHSRKLLMMDILTSETCWAHKKWNKISSEIKLVFHSSTCLMCSQMFVIIVRVLQCRNKSNAVLLSPRTVPWEPLDWRSHLLCWRFWYKLCVCHFGIVEN